MSTGKLVNKYGITQCILNFYRMNDCSFFRIFGVELVPKDNTNRGTYMYVFI